MFCVVNGGKLGDGGNVHRQPAAACWNVTLILHPSRRPFMILIRDFVLPLLAVQCKLRARCLFSFSGCLPEAAFSAFRLRSTPPKLLSPSLDPQLRFFVAYSRRRSSKGFPLSPMCAGRLRAYSRLRCPVMLCPLKMSRLHRHCLIHRRIATPTLMLPLP